MVIPVFNRRHTLLATLASVAAQTRLPDSLVVVDDGSDDDSAELASAWLRENSSQLPWKVVRQQNAGPAAARNHGLQQLGSVDYVAFLDSDDCWPADFLERCAARLQVDATAVAVSCDRLEQYRFWRRSPLPMKDLESDPLLYMLRAGAGIASASLLRVAALRELGGWPEHELHGEDISLFFRLAAFGKWGFVAGAPVLFNRSTGVTGDSINHSRSDPALYKLWATSYDDLLTGADIGDPDRRGRLQAALLRRWQKAVIIYLLRLDFASAAECCARAATWSTRLRGTHVAAASVLRFCARVGRRNS